MIDFILTQVIKLMKIWFNRLYVVLKAFCFIKYYFLNVIGLICSFHRRLNYIKSNTQEITHFSMFFMFYVSQNR